MVKWTGCSNTTTGELSQWKQFWNQNRDLTIPVAIGWTQRSSERGEFAYPLLRASYTRTWSIYRVVRSTRPTTLPDRPCTQKYKKANFSVSEVLLYLTQRNILICREDIGKFRKGFLYLQILRCFLCQTAFDTSSHPRMQIGIQLLYNGTVSSSFFLKTCFLFSQSPDYISLYLLFCRIFLFNHHKRLYCIRTFGTS